jgi:probable rRNA maturation factor
MIEINNLTKEKIDEGFLKKVAKIVLKEENTGSADLSVAFVEEREIKKLNKKYRKKNKPTDVLSFAGSRELKEGLGEVVICLEQVKKSKNDFKKELTLVLIHGILHLLGYDHDKSEKAARIMEQKQEKYFKLFLKNYYIYGPP